MSLLAEIRAEESRRGPQCTVCRLISTMPADDRADLEAAFDDPRVTSAQIARVLQRRYPDDQVRPNTLARHQREHRDGTC